MGFIEQCFETSARELTERLTNAGFSMDQARIFLPEAETGIRSSLEKSSADRLITGLILDGATELLSTVNTGEMAQHLGMNSAQVVTGLKAITPSLLQAFLKNQRRPGE